MLPKLDVVAAHELKARPKQSPQQELPITPAIPAIVKARLRAVTISNAAQSVIAVK